MLDGTLLLAFIAASLVVLLIPGPGVLYVVARSVGQGHKVGVVSAAGLSAGALVHVAAAAIGLSAVLLASATAFTIVKLLGAAYLIYLGLRALFSKHSTETLAADNDVALSRAFLDGVVVSVFNPKIAMFFLAYLPQFVAPALGLVTQQILLLGLIYAALSLLTDSTYAILASRLREWLADQALQGRFPRFLSGGLYLGLGVTAALTSARN